MDAPQLSYYPNTLILPFTYLVSSGAVAANGNAQVTLTMSSDAAFELLGFVASATSDAVANVIPNGFSLLITDQSTGRQLSNTRIPQRMFGSSTYNQMCQEKYPIRFPANCTLLFDFLDLSGQTNTINIGLKGYKLIGA